MKVPLFDIPEKVVESLDVGVAIQTVSDMHNMGLNDPPFKDFAIRMSLRSVAVIVNKTERFVGEEKSGRDIEKKILELWGNQTIIFEYKDFIKDDNALKYNKYISFIKDKNKIKTESDPLSILSENTLDKMFNMAYDVLIVLLATKNVDRKVVINSARSGSKRARDDAKNYNSTTYLNIGKITETCRGGSPGGGLSGPVRPHLRRGHIRLQRYGEGLKESKQIFIQPTFVNADKEWIDRQKTYKFTGSYDAPATKTLTASREARKTELVDHAD